jgi:hypothetical protein
MPLFNKGNTKALYVFQFESTWVVFSFSPKTQEAP